MVPDAETFVGASICNCYVLGVRFLGDVDLLRSDRMNIGVRFLDDYSVAVWCVCACTESCMDCFINLQ